VDNLCITLELWPPSTNSIWRCWKGRVILSRRGRQWYKDALPLIDVPAGCPLEGRLSVAISLHPPNRRSFDLDNKVKVLQDTLTRAGVIRDDSLVDLLTVSRETIVPNGRVDIEICQLPAKT
jgi:crossover junction endodeoxyribonuclease RusA